MEVVPNVSIQMVHTNASVPQDSKKNLMGIVLVRYEDRDLTFPLTFLSVEQSAERRKTHQFCVVLQSGGIACGRPVNAEMEKSQKLIASRQSV